jgi:hypothetical protein
VTPDYSGCYTTLGVTPDTEWNTLRSRYKRLIGTWHPDRFPAGTADKAMAEERSKQITLAYKALETYRRRHGALPPLPSAVPPLAEPVRPDEQHSGSLRPKRQAEPASGDAWSRESASRTKPRALRRIAVFLLTIGALAYFAIDHQGSWKLEEDEPTAPSTPEAAPQAADPSDAPRISVGSTLGEVYSAQGVPTATKGDTWYYGQSQIQFLQGRVVSWVENPANPLRVTRDEPAGSGAFGVGSTRAQVRAIQGPPVTESDTVWDYGPSRVFFERDRVVRWEESPMHPLRVPH